MSDKIRTVTAGALLTAASTGVFANGSAVFMAAVCADLDFARGGFALINSVSLIFSMISLLFFGRLLQAANIRLTVGISAAVCAAVPLGYSFCGALWQFYLTAALNGIFVNGITLLTVATLLERQQLKAKGSLLGASFAGAGIVSFVTLPLIQKTVENFGWRWGYRLQSAAGATLLIAAVLLIKNSAPLSSDDSKNKDFPIKQLLTNRQFMLTAAGLFLANGANVALFNHTSANLSDLGFAPEKAAAVLSFAALISSVSKPCYGVTLDKAGLKAGAVSLGSAIAATAAAALMLNKISAAFYLYPLLLSFCACANSIPANAFASRLFGQQNFAAAASLLTFAATAGSAVGAPLAGVIFDKFGSYDPAWWGCMAAGAASAALLAFAAQSQKSI